ncbi:MAG: hypothetical protein WAU68_06825 [Vitreimonas sp.]
MQHSRDVDLNRVEYRGAISLGQMVALAEYQRDHPEWLAYDIFNLIAPDADFSAVRLDDLDAVVVKFPELFKPSKLLIFRRSAWISFSACSQGHLDHWIARRNTRQNQTQEARQFTTFADAASWLVLSASAASILETGEGFTEMARLESP